MWIIYLFFCGVGAVFIAMALVRIIQMKRCTEVVEGRFIETVKFTSVVFIRPHTTTKAKFFYEYDGKEYYGFTDFGISTKRMNEFSEICKYTLFVNPKNPHKFAYDRKLTLINEIIPLIVGALFIIAPIAFDIWTGFFWLRWF